MERPIKKTAVAPPQKSRAIAVDLRQISPFWPLEFAQSRAEIIYIFMSCDLCNCDDHPNMPCPNCLNCIQHYTTEADYDEVHYDFSEHTAHKPHYKYNGATGEITLVNAEQSTAQTDCTADLIAESYGL